MPNIAENLATVRGRISDAAKRVGRNAEEIRLIAVTKGQDTAAIVEAYKAGVRDFGENRVQEAAEKIQALRAQSVLPTWHLIGHLQTNKVKTALELFDIIHSIDSLRVAESVNSRASSPVEILLEVNIAGEPSKYGFSPKEVTDAYRAVSNLQMLRVIGLMTVAPEVPNPEEARPYFKQLRKLNDSLGLHELSMGMTGDFEVAIEEGATMVRIGRAIFGERKY